MSDIKHPLGTGTATGISNSNGGMVNTNANAAAGVVPSSVALNDANSASINLPPSNVPDDSLALNLNLALAPEAIANNTNATKSSTRNSSGTNTATNSNNNTTLPTPVTISNVNSMDNSNPASNKSTGIPGIRSSIHSIPSNASSPVINNDASTNTMRMFQRMDEMSARLIVVEEMFQKLCKTIDQQSLTITDLKLENLQICKELSQKIDDLSVSRGQTNDTSLQDSFVTDLLNSITNVSSTYLRKIRSRSGNKNLQSMLSPSTSAINELANDFVDVNRLNNHNEQNNGTMGLRNFGDKNSGNATFTLNPNGIKRRKKNDFSSVSASNHALNSNVTSGTQSYTDLNSLNAFGTISLPNLTLEHTGITPLLKNGANGMAFPRLHDNNSSSANYNNIQQQQQQITLQDQQHVNPLQAIRNHKNVSIAVGSERASANDEDVNDDEENREDDDDDGYQEDDDDDNDSEGSDEDDEGDDDEDDEIEEGDSSRRNNNMQKSASDNYEKKEKKQASNRSEHWKTAQSGVGGTSKKDDRLILKNSMDNTHSNAFNKSIEVKGNNTINKSRDMNYTLLKAPSNVRTIWDEYTSGIDGNPPIKRLEEKYGNKWRLNRNRKTFARRKRLYKFILNGISKGKTADEMVNILEERRLYKDENGEIKRRTIGWLQQSLTGI